MKPIMPTVSPLVVEAREKTAQLNGVWCAVTRYVGGEGFEFIEEMQHNGWFVIPSWGNEGWDAGEWPYQSYAMWLTDDASWTCQYTEGDVLIVEYETPEDAVESLDRAIAFGWNLRDRGKPKDLKLDLTGLPENPEYRGPFSWKRLDNDGEYELAWWSSSRMAQLPES